MPTGIYAIRNEVNGKMYIGSAIDISRRLATHFYRLRTNKHPSKHLQAAFNKYGEDAFERSTLEECAPEKLLEREQHWIDTLKPAYNKRALVNNNFGLTGSEKQRRAVSEVGRRAETLERLSEANKAAWADPEKRERRLAAIRAAWTPERRAAQSARQKGVDNGEQARVTRWGNPDAREHARKLKKEYWAKRGAPHTPSSLKALIEADSRWECVSVSGGRASDEVIVYCRTHDRRETHTVTAIVHKGRRCRLCGFQRSSDKQKGRPKEGRTHGA